MHFNSNFSMLRIDPVADEVCFQLYGQQRVAHPKAEDRAMAQSIAKIKCGDVYLLDYEDYH